MPIHITAFTLSIAAGDAGPTSVFLSTFSGGRVFPETTFYGIIDVGGQALEAEATRGQTALQRRLLTGKGSLTTALDRAIVFARQDTARSGEASRAARIAASAICVAQRRNEVYVAAIGPATVVWAREGVVDGHSAREPNQEPWFHRMELGDDDVLVVGNPALERALSEDAWESILDADVDEAARRVFLIARDVPQLSAIFFRGYTSRD